MRKKRRWLRSRTDWDGRPWTNWRLSRDPRRCWPGTENSSLTSLTDRSIANHGVVPESTKKLSGGWCEWRRRIRGGAMTGSWAPWPTWVFSCRIKPWPIFSAGVIFRRFPGGSRLSHPNVAHIYEIGEANGTNFIAMEYVEGQTLDAKLKG